jgi:hypothetical protein
MSGYLTRLAARSLNRTETIEPRLAWRFEEPRQAAAPAGEERWEREATSTEPMVDKTPRSLALERQMPDRHSDPVGQASAAVRLRSGPVRHPDSDEVGSESLTTDMTPDRLRFGKPRDLMPRALQVRPSVANDRRPTLDQPDASQQRPKLESEPTLQSDLVDLSENQVQSGVGRFKHSGRRGQSRESPPTDPLAPRTGQKHPQTEAVMPVPRSRIVPLAGLPASQPRTASTTVEPQRPIVKVSIGRIEVRGIMPPPAATKPSHEQARPSLSLQEYLTRRSGGPQ